MIGHEVHPGSERHRIGNGNRTPSFGPTYRSTNSCRKSGNSRSCSAQRWRSSRATSSDTSRDHPSAVLKPTTRTGLLYWPSNRSLMTLSSSVSSTLVSRHAQPSLPKSSSMRYVSRSTPGTIEGDGRIRNSNAPGNRRGNFQRRSQMGKSTNGEIQNGLLGRECHFRASRLARFSGLVRTGTVNLQRFGLRCPPTEPYLVLCLGGEDFMKVLLAIVFASMLAFAANA